MTLTIKDSDVNAIRRFAKALAGGAVTVGIHEGEAAKEHRSEDDSAGLTVGELAEIHEFGLGVPRRSFIAAWADESQDKIATVVVRGGKALASRKITMPQLLEQTGAWAVGSIQDRMANGIAPDSLVDGRTIRLIDTGQLRSSITYQVKAGPS